MRKAPFPIVEGGHIVLEDYGTSLRPHRRTFKECLEFSEKVHTLTTTQAVTAG